MENIFSCPMANCSMSFDNEDQLNAHKKKHELSLSLLTPSTYKNPFLLDQTPTPTQFLSPISLELQDLSDNPFDVTFRRANSSNHASNNLMIPESSALIASLPDSDVLNTPSITLPSEPATPISLKPNFPKKLVLKVSDNQSCSENTDSLPFTPNEQIVQSITPQESIVDADLPSESANFSSITSSNFALLSENLVKSDKIQSSKSVLQTSVITSVGNTTIVKGNAVGVPTAVVVTRAPVNGISTLSTSQVSVVSQEANQVKKSVPAVVQPLCTVLQLSISLPDGHIVQLPVVTNTQSSAVTASITPQVVIPSPSSKIKLKEVLAQSAKASAAAKKNSSPSKVKSRSSADNLPDTMDVGMSSPPVSPLRPGHNGRKRRDLIDAVDEKRKRSLERNRAAATRCREKRKLWITSLEKKADELARTNSQLQNEVTQLRNEVAHLKTLLLAHKDCPVTLQQKTCYEEERETYTTVRIITPASDDIQCVPSGSLVSPSSSEFMEIEVCSVQSNSDSSLTSDTSEASYRER